MAIPTGTGTEGLRSALFNSISDTTVDLIVGVRYHIYTVLSIIVHNAKAGTSASTASVHLLGYDGRGSASAQTIQLFDIPAIEQGGTYVWSDKFSFYGCENDVTQSTSTVQKLQITGGNAYDLFDITVSYIDQDWT